LASIALAALIRAAIWADERVCAALDLSLNINLLRHSDIDVQRQPSQVERAQRAGHFASAWGGASAGGAAATRAR